MRRALSVASQKQIVITPSKGDAPRRSGKIFGVRLRCAVVAEPGVAYSGETAPTRLTRKNAEPFAEGHHGSYRHSDVSLQFTVPDVLHLEKSDGAEIGGYRRDTRQTSRGFRQPQSVGRRADAAAGSGDSPRYPLPQSADHGDQLQRAAPGKTRSDNKKIPEHQGALQSRGQRGYQQPDTRRRRRPCDQGQRTALAARGGWHRSRLRVRDPGRERRSARADV